MKNIGFIISGLFYIILLFAFVRFIASCLAEIKKVERRNKKHKHNKTTTATKSQPEKQTQPKEKRKIWSVTAAYSVFFKHEYSKRYCPDLTVKDFTTKEYTDEQFLYPRESENIPPVLVGLAVDYLSRAQFESTYEAFYISLAGATVLHSEEWKNLAYGLAANIVDLSDQSITAALDLVQYDTFYRTNEMITPKALEPNAETLHNIRVLVWRTVSFMQANGYQCSGMSWHLGCIQGDADFITNNTLWDLKVSTKGACREHVWQLLTYAIMDKYSECSLPHAPITEIGIFNPRLNVEHRYDLNKLPIEIERYILAVATYGDTVYENNKK